MPLYDKTDPKSIEAFSKRLVNKSLRDFIDEKIRKTIAVEKINRKKGGYGQALEECYFEIFPGTDTSPDFRDAGVELKSSPLKKTKSGLVSKERLVLNIIDYIKMAEESWENSAFKKKNSLLLLIFYLYDQNISLLDYIIKMTGLWVFPKDDLEIIKQDWGKIKAMIEQGKAHEISEGHTNYLAACTKGATSKTVRKQPFSDIPAKQRALSFKQKYVNFIYKELSRQHIDSEKIIKDVKELEKGIPFEQIVMGRFAPYLNKSIEEICGMLHLNLSEAKNRYDLITREILGIRKKKINEFEKADIVVKTIRLRSNGTPKEDISFPAFDYKMLIKEEWEESTFKELLEKRFFLVIYKYQDSRLILKKVMFWTMPYYDLNIEVKKVWKETIKRIKEDRCGELPKKSENRVAHVRPHGRDSSDVIQTPSGKFAVKKSFWLNTGYIKEQIGHID